MRVAVPTHELYICVGTYEARCCDVSESTVLDSLGYTAYYIYDILQRMFFERYQDSSGPARIARFFISSLVDLHHLDLDHTSRLLHYTATPPVPALVKVRVPRFGVGLHSDLPRQRLGSSPVISSSLWRSHIDRVVGTTSIWMASGQKTTVLNSRPLSREWNSSGALRSLNNARFSSRQPSPAPKVDTLESRSKINQIRFICA